MQLAGIQSWHASIDDNPMHLQEALYVRDACRFAVPDDPLNPPPLEGAVVDHASVLSADARRVAGAQWLAWWRDVVRIEGARELGRLVVVGEAPTGGTTFLAAHHHLFGWPDLAALGDRAELRRSVLESHDDAVRWRNERGVGLFRSEPWRLGLPNPEMGAIAQAVIERLDVSPGRVRAAIFVLGVLGYWSALPGPGVLLCSPAVAGDADRLAPLVEAAFASGPDAQAVVLPAAPRR